MSNINTPAAARGSWLQELLYVVIVSLVGTAAFGLGRLSGLQNRGERAVLQVGEALSTSTDPLPLGGFVVALSGGKTYYGPWCGQVKNMPKERQIWYKSAEAAKKAGLTPAGNCKGVE